MSKKIIALIFFTLCIRANASNWISTASGENETSFIDQDSIVYVSTSNLHLKAWIKENFKKNTQPAIKNKQGKIIAYYVSSMALMEFDCVNSKLGTIQTIGYLDDGTIKTRQNYSGVEDFTPDSTGEYWLKHVCKLGYKKPVITYTNPDGTASQKYTLIE